MTYQYVIAYLLVGAAFYGFVIGYMDAEFDVVEVLVIAATWPLFLVMLVGRAIARELF